jgi:hypothetical protein
MTMKLPKIKRLAMLEAAKILRAHYTEPDAPRELFDLPTQAENLAQHDRWRVAILDIADDLERRSKGRRGAYG